MLQTSKSGKIQVCGIATGENAVDWFIMTSCRGGPRARVIPSALEKGMQTIDNKIQDPSELVVEGMVSLGNYGKLGELKMRLRSNEPKDLMWVFSRDATYKNMMLLKIDPASDKNIFDWVTVTLTFQQIIWDNENMADDNSLTYGG